MHFSLDKIGETIKKILHTLRRRMSALAALASKTSRGARKLFGGVPSLAAKAAGGARKLFGGLPSLAAKAAGGARKLFGGASSLAAKAARGARKLFGGLPSLAAKAAGGARKLFGGVPSLAAKAAGGARRLFGRIPLLAAKAAGGARKLGRRGAALASKTAEAVRKLPEKKKQAQQQSPGTQPAGRSFPEEESSETQPAGSAFPEEGSPETQPAGRPFPEEESPETQPAGSPFPEEESPETQPAGSLFPEKKTPGPGSRESGVPEEQSPERGISERQLSERQLSEKQSAEKSSPAGRTGPGQRKAGGAGRRKPRRKRLPPTTAAVLVTCLLGLVIASALFLPLQSAQKQNHQTAPEKKKEEKKIQTDASRGGQVLLVQEEGRQAGESFRGLMNRAEQALYTIRDQVENSLREEYMQILDRGEGAAFEPASSYQKELWKQVRAERRKELQEEPLLLLVNKWHYLPEDYEAEPIELPNGQSIGSVCYEELIQMLNDCTEAGGTPIVCSGYRPHWYQVNLFSAQVDRWLYAGYSQEESETYAATAVAIPGTSEHELGLAADIYSSENMDLDESQIYTFTQQWLMENCWRYGFVLRYPQDKSDITGIIFEPWHYRYVGYKHAKKIHEAGICLEEYLDEAEHP